MNDVSRTPEMSAADAALAAKISDWILAEGLRGTAIRDLMEGFCDQLSSAGFPLMRGFTSFQTLHPLYSGYGFIWRRADVDVEENSFLRQTIPSPAWTDSPFFYMLQNNVHTLRACLEGETEREFPVYDDFRAEGATGYFARLVGFGELDINKDEPGGVAYSFLTDCPGGFADSHIAMLEKLMPVLSLAIKARSTYQIATEILGVYIGHDAGRRVFSGTIERGDVQTIGAVIFFADLRGFTRLSETLDGGEVVAMLDDYLDAIARPLLAQGGEVLKFMGDGLMGTFEIGDADPAEKCQAALTATHGVMKGLAALSQKRRAAGQPVMELDVALHLGDVLYGNVGSENRLDFTVIGPAVNEASRMEALCRPLGHSLLVSEAFANAASADCRGRLISIGRHRLRDIPGDRELFTVEVGDCPDAGP